jgi:hypothetical protein
MLLQRSEKERANLTLSLRALDSRLQTDDGGMAAWQRAVTNPLVIALAIAALLSLRRRPGLRLLMRGAVLLAASRRISREVKAALSGEPGIGTYSYRQVP